MLVECARALSVDRCPAIPRCEDVKGDGDRNRAMELGGGVAGAPDSSMRF
eukprot:m.782220 g.782220  ORF g.782220 m.782220 type:complete len:50 (-) comp23289_c0_seq8:7896-8045(-)